MRLERLAAAAPQRDGAQGLLGGAQRRHHQALDLLLDVGGVVDLHRPRVEAGVVDLLGLAALDDRADDAHAHPHHGVAQLLLDRPAGDDGAVAAAALGRVVGRHEDGAVVGTQQLARVVGDALHHLADVERGRDLAAHLGQRRALARLALVLGEQARVLQRRAQRAGDGLQQAHVAVAVGVFALEALQHHGAEGPVASHDGHAQEGEAAVGAWDDGQAGSHLLGLRAQQARLALGHDAVPRRARPDPLRGDAQALAMLHLVEVVQRAGSVVVPADAQVLRAQHLADLLAHQLDDAVKVELAGDALLDAVDDGQLGIALLGFFQQTLGFVEAQRALQRHGHGRADGLQQAHLGVAIRVLALVVLHLDAADAAVADDQRHGQGAGRNIGAGHV